MSRSEPSAEPDGDGSTEGLAGSGLAEDVAGGELDGTGEAVAGAVGEEGAIEGEGEGVPPHAAAMTATRASESKGARAARGRSGIPRMVCDRRRDRFAESPGVSGGGRP